MKKRRKLKIFLLSFLVLVLAAGGYLLYEFKWKTYDVADEEVDEIVGESYIVELPDGSKVTIDENGEMKEVSNDDSTGETATSNTTVETSVSVESSTSVESSSSQGGTKTKNTESSNKEATKGSGSGDSPSSNKGEQEVTVATIKQKYEPVFVGIESQADAKINALVGKAKKEYQDKKASGEGINFAYFYNKYMGAANSLEASTDNTFYGVLSIVEKELESNGFDKSYAQSFKEEYEAKKKTRRDSILSKALGK